MQPERFDLVDKIDLGDPGASLLDAIRAGAEFVLVVILSVSDDGTGENLAGKTFRLDLRRKVDDPGVLMSASTEDQRIVVAGLTGEMTIRVPGSATRDIAPGRYVYGLAETTGGALMPVLEGIADVVLSPVR